MSYLNRLQELVQVVCKTWLRVSFLCVWEQIYLRLFSLWLLRETSIHVQEAIAHKPADG